MGAFRADDSVVVGKYVIARAAFGVWDDHHVVYHGNVDDCVAWAKANQDVVAPGVEWTT